MMALTIQIANPVRRPHCDGKGYEVCNAYSGHHAQLQIGNVSVAFDGRDIWSCPDSTSPTLQFAEYTDDPVRLAGVSCSKCDDVAETIMFALAADLGYTLNK